ncbi:MAG TPA: ABC transporter ATP-binding protein [Lachnospiraceae bacterium]|nr:ABC transporter ATP-binding protein [Lachnospiraceae bacterium]
MDSIVVDNVTKRFKNGVEALSGVSFQVKSGEIFSLLGRNGAGKSTLIKILTTFLSPTSGDIKMFGMDIYKEPASIRESIACAAQHISIDTHMSLVENMMFQSKLYHVAKEEAGKRMDSLIQCFHLERYMKYPVASYSGGVKRRLDIALSMMSNPKILFLDEPTVGMDIQSRKVMWDMVKKIRDEFGTTVFLTTHYMDEAEMLSDSICIIHNGKEVTQGTTNELRDYLQQDFLTILFSSSEEAIKYRSIFRKELGLKDIDICQNELSLKGNINVSSFKRLNYFLLDRNVAFSGIEIKRPSLEEIFTNLTGGELGKEEMI